MSVSTTFDLTGRRAIVTGASRGLGRTLAVGLAAHGARVLCVARSEEGLVSTAKQIADHGTGEAVVHAADLRSEEGIRGTVARAVEAFGGIDILINNAADDHDSAVEDTDQEVWDRIIDLNLDSCFKLSKEAGPYLKAGGVGRVVNVISILAAVGVRDNSAYIAAKTGLLGFTRALALEWARAGVQVNAIGPGFFKTEMTRHVWDNERASKWITNRTPMGRWGDPEDLVGAAVFLSSDAARFVTGQALYVDGGWTAQ